MHQADHRGEVQIRYFSGSAHVLCKLESSVRLIPVAIYAHVLGAEIELFSY